MGRIFLRPGRLAYAGVVGATAAHAHHAFQIVLSVSGPITLVDAEGGTLETRAAVIPPDTVHALASSSAAVMFYVDPDDVGGRRLRRRLAGAASLRSWSDAAISLATLAPQLPTDWEHLRSVETVVLETLAIPALVPRTQHPAVTRALKIINDEATSDLSLPTIAAAAGLSPSRFSHDFALDTGIPLRRYVLWRRLMGAADELAAGATLTRAAHAGGFADSAHMNHVFRRMFGLAPSDVTRSAEWLIAAR